MAKKTPRKKAVKSPKVANLTERKRLNPIMQPDDIQWQPPTRIIWLRPLLNRLYRTEFWPRICEEVEKIRSADGTIARFRMLALGQKLSKGLTGESMIRDAAPIEIEGLHDYQAMIEEARDDPVKYACMEWVSQNLWRVPAVFKWDKASEYDTHKELFTVHPPGSGQDNEAPTGAHWSWLIWAAKDESKFFNMMFKYFSDAARTTRTAILFSDKATLVEERKAKSGPKQIPNYPVGPGLSQMKALQEQWTEGDAPAGRRHRKKPVNGSKTIQVDATGKLLGAEEKAAEEEDFSEEDL